MEALGNLNSTLWNFHARQETSRVVRTSWSIFRCLLFFDVIYLMSGVALMVMGLCNDDWLIDDNFVKLQTMILSGASLGIFATVSAMCNSLACHGLRSWKRNFLLPWLSFYFLVLGFLATFLPCNLPCPNCLQQKFPRTSTSTRLPLLPSLHGFLLLDSCQEAIFDDDASKT